MFLQKPTVDKRCVSEKQSQTGQLIAPPVEASSVSAQPHRSSGDDDREAGILNLAARRH